MVAYLKEMDRGYPGALSRTHQGGFVLETRVAGAKPLFFGMAVSVDAAGQVIPFDTTKSTVHGFLVRPFPKQGNMALLGEANPSYEGELVTVMLRGYMTVNMETGTAKPGDVVFPSAYSETTPPVYTVRATAAASGGDSIPGARFTGVATGGITEVSIGIYN